MADVKWIKLDVDIFSNPKVKHLRRLPDGNNIFIIFIMLLTMAGRCNDGGFIHITKDIQYSEDDLADELGFPVETVGKALQEMERLGMISSGGGLHITGWGDHQNLEGMDKIREQNRIRKQRQRERDSDSRDSHVTVTQCHATDKDIDIDIELDKETEEDINHYNHSFYITCG